jgi:hypothetical protein
MHRLYRNLSVVAVLLVLAVIAFAQEPIVPLDHPVYRFLRRMETKGIITGYFGNSLPLDRGQVCELLQQVNASGVNDRLRGVDCSWLRYFRQEFWECEWGKSEAADSVHGWRMVKDTGFLKWLRVGNFWEHSHDWFWGGGDDYAWAINPVLRFDGVEDDRYDDTVLRRTSGITIRGVWRWHVGAFFQFRDTKEWGNGPYWDRSQVYDDRYGYVGPLLGDDFTYYDRTDYGIHLRWGPVRLEGGKWENQWGPGRWGHLMFSGEGTSYDQVGLRVKLGRWGQFSAFTGALRHYPPLGDTLYVSVAGEPRVVEASKYVSGHRLDVKPFSSLQIGISEMVVYGDRGIEIGYLIPLNLYYSAEHHYGDQDNVIWGMDVKYTGIDGVRWYGEMLIDDISLSRIGTFYECKWAALLGAEWVDPVGLSNFDVGAEATLVRPHVYTHRFLVGTPTHWTRPLGFGSPPNCLTWMVGSGYQPHRSLRVSTRFGFLKHGANTDELNVGGNLNLPFRPGDPEYISFFDGEVEESQCWTAEVSWEPLPRLRLEVAGGSVTGDVEEYDWMRIGFYLNYW